MRPMARLLWFLIFLSVPTALVRCGHSSKKNDSTTTPNDTPYVPADWDGESDWTGNTLKVEDIAP